MRPARARLEQLDADWAQLRAKDDIAAGWKWASVAAEPEVFAVVDANDQVLAIWRAKKRVDLGKAGTFYRLDNIEVQPGLRGGQVGRFTILLVSARAHELGQAILLAAPQERVNWYVDQGAAPADNLGWKCPNMLVPLQFTEDAVRTLKEKADVLEEK